MALDFFVTDSLAVSNGVKVLIFGGPGAGKTRLLASAPRPFIFSCENGLLSLRDQRIPGVRITTYDQLIEAYSWAIKSREAQAFDTWCLDSGSDIAEKVLFGLLGKTKDNRQAYGEMATSVVDLFKSFRDVPNKNVVITAKVTLDVDALTGARSMRPLFPGKKLGEDVPYLFDEVFYLGNTVAQDGSIQNYLKTRDDGRVYGKDRSGTLDTYEPANLSYLFQKITGAKYNGVN